MADIQSTLKRSGLTPGKAILIGVLGVVLVGIVYKQFGPSGETQSVTPTPAVIESRLRAGSTPALSTSQPAVVEAATGNGAQVELLQLDQERWKSPELSTVIAYDPFALPPSFPQPPKTGIAAELADGTLETSVADAEQLAEALENLKQQLEQLKQRGVHVILNKQDQYVAMIGDRMIHVGDEINGFVVTEIDLQGVRVERKDAE